MTLALLLLLLLLLNFIYSAPVSTEDPQTPSPAAHRALLSPPTPPPCASLQGYIAMKLVNPLQGLHLFGVGSKH